LGQSLLRKVFCCTTYFDGLRHRNIEILRLFNKASRRHFVRFRRVNEIKTKQVFLSAGTHMEAVAIIRPIQDEPALFQDNPISALVSRAKIDSRAPNNNSSNERGYTVS